MTVCVGALCENGKAAVVAADEMVTFGPPRNLQTEPVGLKNSFVTQKTFAALAKVHKEHPGLSDDEEKGIEGSLT